MISVPVAGKVTDSTPGGWRRALQQWLMGSPAPAAGRPEGTRAGVPLDDPIRIGHYTIVRKLGEGGMGAVYAARAAAQPDTGYFSVDALPYAQIYVDGAFVGITPLVRIPLRPGRHSVRAVAESGASERLTITVRAGETVSRRIRLETLRP